MSIDDAAVRSLTYLSYHKRTSPIYTNNLKQRLKEPSILAADENGALDGLSTTLLFFVGGDEAEGGCVRDGAALGRPLGASPNDGRAEGSAGLNGTNCVVGNNTGYVAGWEICAPSSQSKMK